MKLPIILIGVLILVVFTILNCSSGTEPPPFDPFGKFSIDFHNNDSYQGHYTIVQLTLDSLVSTKLTEFSFLIAYPEDGLNFIEATVGNDLACWDNFDYETVIVENCEDDCPPGLVRITGSMGSGDISGCDGADGEFASYPITIADLKFYAPANIKYECGSVPIYFYWMDCDDNRINISQSSMQYYSRSVYDVVISESNYDYEILIPPDGTIDDDDHIYGVNPDCLIQISQSMLPISVFNLDFYNGGMKFNYENQVGSELGDVDLNGMPYELDDVDLLADYLVDGSSVFTEDQGQQWENADVISNNAVDILDLYYMTIKYRDEDNPVPPQGYNPDDVFVQTSYQNVYIQSMDKIYAVRIVLDAEVNIMAPEFDTDYKVSARAGKTYILFYNLDDDYIAPGTTHLLSYSGAANLVSIQLCSEYATFLPIYFSN